jgi:hypothetical protein
MSFKKLHFNDDPEEIAFCEKNIALTIYREGKFLKGKLAPKNAYLKIYNALKYMEFGNDAGIDKIEHSLRMFDWTDQYFKKIGGPAAYKKLYIATGVTWKKFYTNVKRIGAEKYDHPAEIYYYIGHVLGLDTSDEQKPAITKKMLEEQPGLVAKDLARLVVKAFESMNKSQLYKILYRKRFAGEIKNYQEIIDKKNRFCCVM